MSRLESIFAVIEKAAEGAAQALAPVNPTIAIDIALGAELLAIISRLMPHAKAAAITQPNGN